MGRLSKEKPWVGRAELGGHVRDGEVGDDGGGEDAIDGNLHGGGHGAEVGIKGPAGDGVGVEGEHAAGGQLPAQEVN